MFGSQDVAEEDRTTALAEFQALDNKGEVETQQDPVGPSWAQKPFCVPRFLFVGNRLHSAFLTFPESKG